MNGCFFILLVHPRSNLIQIAHPCSPNDNPSPFFVGNSHMTLWKSTTPSRPKLSPDTTGLPSGEIAKFVRQRVHGGFVLWRPREEAPGVPILGPSNPSNGCFHSYGGTPKSILVTLVAFSIIKHPFW